MDAITAIVDASRRELAQRSGDDIEVTLYWDSILDAVSVEVRDTTSGESFEITVPSDQALEAFHHPDDYGAWHGVGAPTSKAARI